MTRGEYVTYAHYFHGEDAVGIYSMLDYQSAPELTLMDGFDIEPTATETVARRHGLVLREANARQLFDDSMARVPMHRRRVAMHRVDVVFSGSPCKRASWAPHYNLGTEPNADDPMNALYPDTVHAIVEQADAALMEFVSDVKKLRSPVGSINEHRPPGWRHDDVVSNFESYGWTTHVHDVNAHMHGSPGARRRLYTPAFSARVVAAAQRAGIEFQYCDVVPHDQRRVFADALVCDDVIDEYHPHLYTNHQLTVPRLHGDRRDTRQVARINTGKRETEPVGDARLAAMPMKCFGEAPLVMLPNGRVRRTLLSEFAAVGSVPWSVDRLMGANPTVDEVRRAKTMMGNTWDGVLTRKLVDATLAYMAPFIKERAMLAAEPARVAARFMTVMMRVLLPIRRMWRRWCGSCMCVIGDDERSTEVAAIWQRFGESAVMLHVRRAVGFMGMIGCANALWRTLTHGAAHDDRITSGDGRNASISSAGVNTAAGVSKSGSVHLTPKLDAAMFGSAMGWHECIAVTVSMMPDCRNTPTQKLWGTRLALPSEVRCSSLHERPLPLTRQPPGTSRPPEPWAPSTEQQAAFVERFKTEESVFTDEGISMKNAYEQGMVRDAEGLQRYGTEGPDAWHVRMKQGEPPGETRLTQQHLQPEAQGVPIAFDPDTGVPRIDSPVPISARMKPEGDVEILMAKLKEWMILHSWKDRYLRWVCDWGWADLTESRPWVMSFSPNMKAAYERYPKVCAAQNLEVDRRWSRRSKRIPYAGKLHIVPTNAVDKSDGSARLLGNATWPCPDTYLDFIEGAAVAPNVHTDWSRLPHFEWASIDRFAEGLAILCAVASIWQSRCPLIAELLYVVGSRDDLVKWFRQIPLFSGDHCLQCYHWGGVYIVDMHVQMGRQSSADGAQRISFVAGAIVFEAVEAELERLLSDDTSEPVALWSVLRSIVADRREHTGSRDTGLWFLDVMQDDLGYAALSAVVGSVIRDTIPAILAEYGIQVSMDKRAEDEAVVEGPQPNQRMLYIGADFYCNEIERPMHRGQDKSIKRFEEIILEWDRYPPGRLVPLELLQTAIGMGLFHGRFQYRARRYINSGLRCLRGRNGLRRVVSRYWKRDLATLWQRTAARVPFPLVRETRWHHPGLLGCNSDASRPQGEGDHSRGLGGNVMHAYFFDEWSELETKWLDISTLELIAVAYLVVVAALSGQLQPRMVIRCDNEAACRVINDHCTESVAMGEALMLLESVQCHYGVELLAHHIAGVDNTIADDLSRDRVNKAIDDLRHMTGCEPYRVQIPTKWRDISGIVNAVRS